MRGTFTGGVQPASGLLGILALAAAAIGMRRGWWPFASHVYDIVWWATIAILDAAVWLRRGRSPLLGRPARLALLSLWSVAFWFFFELVNLRMRNWHYIHVAADAWPRWWGSFVAFATVLPGVLLCAELLAELPPRRKSGGDENPRPPPARRIPGGFLAAAFLAGLFSLALPLLWPVQFFPLVWGSLFLLLEPINYRTGAFSFLATIEEGNWRPAARWLGAGLLCGLWWELWNYWARVKWIYTVPFFEELKLFEMPLLGFLGFPPFALECSAFAAALERWALLPAPGTARLRPLAWPLAALAAFSCAGLALPAMDRSSFASVYPALEEFTEIPAAIRADLAAQGCRDGFQLLDRVRGGELAPWRDSIELAMLRGMGAGAARALAGAGVRSVEDLAAADDAVVLERLSRQELRRRPSPVEIRGWIRAAKRLKSPHGR